MVEVRLRAVRVDLQSNTPVLLLQETEGLGRTLPIFIGAPEATAIAFALQGMDTPRPMTHDLIRDLLESLGADVIRVVVTELRSSTYHADIVLRTEGREVPVSSRPSDAVAVAVRTGAPLFVADDLMDAEGIMLAVDEEEEDDDSSDDDATEESGNPEEIVGEFRSFLDSIRPEDFSS
jgi:bifunctional DNase/RNase